MPSHSDIRLVSLDLDRTLVDAPGCVTPAVRAAFRMARDRGRSGHVVVEAIAEFVASGRPERRPDRLMDCFGFSADDPLGVALREAFAGNDGTLTAIADAAAVMERLGRAASIVVVTNGYLEIQAAKLRRTGLDRFVSALVASEAIGIKKPDPAIFAHVSKLTGIPPTAAVHVGDSLAEDIAGASAAGYASILFQPGQPVDQELGNAVPSARVTALCEIPPLLGLS